MVDLPKVMTPEEVARHFGWSPRRLRSVIAEHGICHKIGNRVVMTEENVKELLEITKPQPKIPPRPAVGAFGWSYEDLVRLRERQRREAKAGGGNGVPLRRQP